jgi:putative membrane protein
MIVRERPSAVALFYILRGSTVPTIAPRVLVVVAVAAGVTWAARLKPEIFHALSPTPLALVGLALSIFLGFRNNGCYERWWEGRRQWGQLLAQAAGFARDARVLLEESAGRSAALRLIAFADALRTQLRGQPPARSPHAILLEQAQALAALFRAGALTDIQYRLFSDRLQAITDVQLACERLASTPLPFAYSLLLHRTAWLVCLFAPFVLVASLGLATPIAAAILAYAFFGLDALGEELEAPFSERPNALPLNALLRTLERTVLATFDEADLPPPLTPVNHVLL